MGMDKKKIGIIAVLVLVFTGAGFFWWNQGSAERAQGKMDLAVKYITENNYEKAILAYNDAIKIDSKAINAYMGLAKVYTLQGKYEQAQATYEKGLAKVDDNEQQTLQLGLAGMYIDQWKMDEAEKSFQNILNSSPACLEAYWGLAMAYQQQGDNTKAEKLLRQAIEKNPNEYRPYNTLALFLNQNGQSDQAFENLTKSLVLEINQQEAYLVLKDLFQTDWSQLLSKASGVSDQNVAAMLEFYSYYAAGDYQNAVNIFDSKLSNQADNHKAQILAAIAMTKTGNTDRAQELIMQLANKKVDEWLLSDIAEYYFAAGDKEKARLTAINALEAQNSNLDAVAILQRINTNDEDGKIYAAAFLLYNWKPVAETENNLTMAGIKLSFVVSNSKKELQTLSKEEKRNLNIFFSNFSEVSVPTFKENEISNEELIKFGFIHNLINNRDRVQILQDSQQCKIAKQYIEESVKKYFNKTVQNQSIDQGPTYDNGFYYNNIALGEGRNFSQLNKLYYLGNDYYLAYINVYSEGFEQVSMNAGTDYLYIPLEDWSQEYINMIELVGEKTATIKKVTENGASRYILVDYLDDKMTSNKESPVIKDVEKSEPTNSSNVDELAALKLQIIKDYSKYGDNVVFPDHEIQSSISDDQEFTGKIIVYIKDMNGEEATIFGGYYRSEGGQAWYKRTSPGIWVQTSYEYWDGSGIHYN